MTTVMTPAVRDWLALTLVEGLGGRTVKALLERFGTIEALLSASPEEIRRAGRVRAEVATRISRAREVRAFEIEQKLVERHGVGLVPFEGPEYPPLLREIYAPPPLLYVKGQLPGPESVWLAVVGTRKPTRYGQKVTLRLVEQLAALVPELVVVSGLARGIDSCAHRQALASGLRTVAVLAGGLSDVYPPENRELADRIAAQGALVTEFHMAQKPLARHFPIRNRIISGVSAGVLVVEAGETSGALITAGFGLNHGREVFAVPGAIDLDSFRGVNRLIQKGQAKLVREAGDIVEELLAARRPRPVQLDAFAPPPAVPAPAGSPENPQRRAVFDAVQEVPLHPDEVAGAVGLPIESVLGLLLELELSGEICQTEDNLYGPV
ncbi:MAG: DNA-protecting protein DprA [Candidatus Lambdaproteobacteria bacterium]|nr:DNA-protecting protein DprA [Candidatus Lambdaproteobacteria bacterium]